MYGPAKEPKFPTKIAFIFKIVGWLFIVWSIVNWFIVHWPIHISIETVMDESLLRSMGILYFILGMIFIMNGIAISKMIEATKYEMDRALRNLK